MLERTPTDYDEKIYPQDWREWADPELPEWIEPIDHLIDRHVTAGRGGKTAVVADGASVSYSQLQSRIELTAAALADAGCVPGERLLLFGTDSLDYVCVWLASVRLGAVPVVVSDLYKTEDLLYFLTDTAAGTLFIDVEQIEKLDAISTRLPHTLQRVIVRGAPSDTAVSAPARHSLEALLSDAGEAGRAWRWHSDDICYMFYSGGTTGKAKGITHLAHDFFIVPARHGAFWEYTQDDVVLATSRKYFTHGLWPGVLIPLAHGATVILDRRPPSPDVVLELLEANRATKFVTVPTILKNMITYGRTLKTKPDLSSVRLVISASEKISPEVFDNFETMFGLEILDSIGSSEVTYEWIANRPGESCRGSLGKPVFGCEIRLVDKDGQDVTVPDVPGEAWVRSRTACLFYWRKLDKTRETFVGGWTRTGDNLFFDAEGFFWFSGRDNDVFKVKGLWISPLEIEAAVASHKAVLEAAVVSYEDAEGFTKPRCYVVLDSGERISDGLIEELRLAVKPLGGYKVPEEFKIVESLPRTTLMKIDRRALRENPAAYA